MNTGDLHQALLEAGQSIARDELDAERAGPSTREAVVAFQRANGLVADGIAGPKTWAALRSPRIDRFTDAGFRCDASLARAEIAEVLRVALGEIGAVEVPLGSNRGPRVDVYCGKAPGTPWCAWFVSWCQQRAGVPAPRIGSVWGWYEWGQRRKRVTDKPQPGDLAIIRRANRRGHVAFVAAVLDDGRIATIGGNEGNAVRGRVRRVSDFSDFVRLAG